MSPLKTPRTRRAAEKERQEAEDDGWVLVPELTEYEKREAADQELEMEMEEDDEWVWVPRLTQDEKLEAAAQALENDKRTLKTRQMTEQDAADTNCPCDDIEQTPRTEERAAKERWDAVQERWEAKQRRLAEERAARAPQEATLPWGGFMLVMTFMLLQLSLIWRGRNRGQ